ncbi:DUF1648 domain-containing protein [Aquimarina sp. M1]
MKNPIIKVKKEVLDIVLEVLTGLGLGVMVLIPIFYFNDLPEIVPTHFNIKGRPDDYSKKSMIWILPAIGWMLGISLYVLNKFPHAFNYPTKISGENAFQIYKDATRLIRMLNLIIIWSFVYVLYQSIRVAINKSEGLGSWFIPVFIGIIFSTIIYYILKSKKSPKN